MFDDCSDDDTADVALRLGAKVIRSPQNVGYCRAKNALLHRVGCDWVHFHDADDVLYPEYVARAKQRLDRDAFDALLYDYEVVF